MCKVQKYNVWGTKLNYVRNKTKYTVRDSLNESLKEKLFVYLYICHNRRWCAFFELVYLFSIEKRIILVRVGNFFANLRTFWGICYKPN